MKIKVIHPITRLIVGGAQQNTIDTCTLLDKKRFDAKIITGQQTGPEGSLIPEAQEKNILLATIPELVRQPSPFKDFTALMKMYRIFKSEKPHVVHTHSSKAGIIGRLAAKAAMVPVIIHTVHGWGYHDHQSFFMKQTFYLLERFCEKLTDKLIVVSRLNSEKGLHDGIGSEKKYTTIHSSIELKPFLKNDYDTATLKKELGLHPKRPVVGTVGRLSAQKNPSGFVKTAHLIKKSIPETQFVFIGDGPLRNETENMISQMQLESSIFLPGIRSDVAALLKCFDVFILTSLWEGLPRVIPQAMASGLPVAANAVDGVTEVIEDGKNGFLIPAGNVEMMAEKVVLLLKNPALRKQIAEHGVDTAIKEFSVTDMIKRIAGLYEEMMDKRSLAFKQIQKQ